MSNMKQTTTTNPWLTLLLLAGALLFGCTEKAQSDPTGSETHWLHICSVDADCDTGGCLCGVCSTSCESTAACGEGERCEDSEQLDCAGANVPDALCLPTCEGDSCGPDGSCQAGLCVPLVNGDDSG